MKFESILIDPTRVIVEKSRVARMNSMYRQITDEHISISKGPGALDLEPEPFFHAFEESPAVAQRSDSQ